jgi:hypothetical protein
MKINLAVLLIVILLFISSCKHEKAAQITEEGIPVIDLEYAFDHLSNDRVNFSEFAKDITYIPMETNKKSVYGGKHAPIYNITEKHIFAGDMMFRRDGSFVRQLGKKGQGPEEYLMALGIAVDEEREEFYVYDNYLHDIFIYDFNNNFKKRVRACSRVHDIKSLENGKIMLMRDIFGGVDIEYRIIDTNTGEVIYTRSFPVLQTEEQKEMHHYNLVWHHDDKMVYYEPTNDTIFALKDGQVDKPRYIIHKGKYKNVEEPMKIGAIVECSPYLLFSISYGRILYYMLYHKETGKIRMNKFDKFFNNDIDGGFLWLYEETSDGQEGFYSIFPYLAKERIESLSSQNKGYDRAKNEKLRQFIDSLEEDDNAILYFFDLK